MMRFVSTALVVALTAAPIFAQAPAGWQARGRGGRGPQAVTENVARAMHEAVRKPGTRISG